MRKILFAAGDMFTRKIALAVMPSLLALAVLAGAAAAQLPDKDTRAERLIDADHFELRIHVPRTVAELEARREEVRQKFMLTAGLWPPPEKNALNPVIFDEKAGDGFRVAKVYFESLPGYYVTGNLYRPATGDGPFPAVICPHGHWTYGRLTNGVKGSIPGRSIDLAKMGFVVISIDMVGYNDNIQMPHDHNKSLAQMKADKPLPYESRKFRGVFDFPRAELYGMSLAGLHVWNVIRTVDFLTSLPEVDDERIGCTGASGGASQTLFLMACEPRLKVAAPVNIISAAKHPGCGCENPPGSWVDISTVEIAGLFAPKPLILLSATEDPWTNSFPTRELPIIKKYYELYGAGDKVKNVHVKDDHNYNAESRAAVYLWFAEHLKSSRPAIKDVKSPIPGLDKLGDLRVFPDQMLPASAKQGLEVIDEWIAASEKTFLANLPRNRQELDKFAATFGRNLSRVLQVSVPAAGEVISLKTDSDVLGGIVHEQYAVGRQGRGERFAMELVGSSPEPKGTLVLVRPEWRGGMFQPGGGGFKPALKNIAVQDYRIVRVGGFASGDLAIPRKVWDTYSWPEAYNMSNELNGIQDILTALVTVRKQWPNQPITLAGLGESGLLAAFAGAIFGECERVIVDLHRTDPGYDGELLDILPVGSIKRVGDFRTAMLMLIRGHVALYNSSPTFEGQWYADQAKLLSLGGNLELHLDEQLNWLTGQL